MKVHYTNFLILRYISSRAADTRICLSYNQTLMPIFQTPFSLKAGMV